MTPWGWIEILGRSSLEGGLLILAVWAVCRLWPAIPAWTRSGLWWLATVRLLLGLLPLTHWTIHAPMPVSAVWWPAAVAGPSLPEAEPEPDPASAPAMVLGGQVASPAAGPPIEKSAARTIPWDPRWIPIALVTLWAAGFSLRAYGLSRQRRRVRAALRAARPMPEDLAAILEPGDGVRLAVSALAPVPLVTGALRLTVLMPVSMLGRPPRDLRLALFHELAHVRRRDLWLAWAPALAEAVFWFHPLVRLCVREYALACEEACDVEALRATGAHPHDYGRLLMAFGVHDRFAGATAMPCGSPDVRQLIRRLSMLRPFVPSRPGVRSAAIGLLCAFGLVGLVPLRVVPTAAAPRPSPNSPAAGVASVSATAPMSDARTVQVAMAAGEAPEAPPQADRDLEDSDASEGGEDPGDFEDTSEDDVLPPLPAVPRAPRAPRAATPGHSHTSVPGVPYASRAPRAPRSGVSWGYDDSDGERLAYVLVHRDGGSFTGSGTGNVADWQEVKKIQRKLDHDFLWVRVGDDHYLIEDEDVLRRADEIFRPQREIGQRQSEIGDIQSRIGDRQSEIGDEQSRIGDRQSEMAERQAELARRMARRDLQRSEAGELDRQMEELSRQLEDLSREQERLGWRMEPLGHEQEKLGARMEALSKEMARTSRESGAKLRALIDEAIRTGAARPIR